MPETYGRKKTEKALLNCGFNILQEQGYLVTYQRNVYPGDELLLDWSRKQYDWEDLKRQLGNYGIDPEPIHTELTSS